MAIEELPAWVQPPLDPPAPCRRACSLHSSQQRVITSNEAAGDCVHVV